MTERGAVGRADMSAGVIWASGVEGSMIFRFDSVASSDDDKSAWTSLWIRRGEGFRARFWLRVIEAGDVAENGDNRDMSPC